MSSALQLKTSRFDISFINIPNDIPYIVSVSFDNNKLDVLIQLIVNSSLVGTQKYQPFAENIYLDPSFEKLAFDVFDEIIILQKTNPDLAVGVADFFFNNICNFYWNLIINMNSKNLACRFLEEICLLVDKWEKNRSNRIHKGTPYYFLTYVYRQMGDIDSAFASAFRAIQEDIDSKVPILGKGTYRNSPAYRYASIVDNKNNYLYDAVKELRSILEEYIKEFNSLSQKAISMNDLDTKLFQSNIEQIGHFFVYTLELIRKYLMQIPTLPKNDFYRMKNIRDMFNLCLIADKILESKYETDFLKNIPKKPTGEPTRGMYIRDGVTLLFEEKGWIPTLTQSQKRDPKGSLIIIPNLPEDPQDLIEKLFLKPIPFNVNGNQASTEMRIMLLTLCLRNIGAHEMGKQDIFVAEYKRIIKSLIFSIFIATSVL